MSTNNILRYPIGKFKAPKNFTDELREEFISEIEETPFHLRNAVENLDEDQLNTPYRQGDGQLSRLSIIYLTVI